MVSLIVDRTVLNVFILKDFSSSFFFLHRFGGKEGMENLSRALIIITCITFHPVEDGLLIYRGGGRIIGISNSSGRNRFV